MKQKIVLIFLALLTSILINIPLLPFLFNKECFLISSKQLNYIDGDETGFYLPKTAGVAKGNFGVGDSSIYEHRNNYNNTSEKIPPLITGIIQYLTKNIELTYILTKLIFVFLGYIYLYKFLTIFIKNKLFIHLFLLVIFFIPEIYQSFNLPFKSYLLPLGRYLRRYYITITVLPFFFIFQKIILKYLLTKKLINKDIIQLSLLIGIFSLSYIFYWVYSLVFLTIITTYLIFKNKFNIKKSIINLLKILALPILFSSFYIFNLINEIKTASEQSGFGKIFKIEAAGEYQSHWYYGNMYSVRRTLIFIAILILIKIYFEKLHNYNLFKNKKFIFLFFSIIVSEICYNLNIITGISIQFDHFYYVISILQVLLLCTYLIYIFIQKNNFKYNIFCTVGIILIILVEIVSQYKNINLTRNYIISCNEKNYYQILNLIKTFPKNSVIHSNSYNLNQIIQLYTSNYIFIDNMSYYYSTIQFDEIVKRLVIIFKIQNYDKSFLLNSETIDNNSTIFNQIIGTFNYCFTYNKNNLPQQMFNSIKNIRINGINYISVVPLEIKKKILKEYNNIDIKKIPYKLDYLIINKNESNFNNIYPENLKMIYENTDYLILKYN